MSANSPTIGRLRYARSILLRLASFVLGWIVLTEGDLRDAWLGGVVAVLACAASYRVLPAGAVTGLRLGGLLRYLGYFAVQSVAGGVDVSLRALRPAMPVRPAFTEVDLDLPSEGLRVLLAWTVSLLPGTASVVLEDRRLVIHMLCDDAGNEQELRRLEAIIRGLAR